jgi:hypothetical protein
MALMKCSDCGRDASSQATACPACGRPMGYAQRPATHTRAGCAVGLLVVALVSTCELTDAGPWRALKRRQRATPVHRSAEDSTRLGDAFAFGEIVP